MLTNSFPIMNWRTFAKSAFSAAAAAASLPVLSSGNHQTDSNASHSKNSFAIKFAPHDGHFKHSTGKNTLDQIRYAHYHGFTACTLRSGDMSTKTCLIARIYPHALRVLKRRIAPKTINNKLHAVTIPWILAATTWTLGVFQTTKAMATVAT